MAIPNSSERGDLVLTSTGPKIDDAIAGLLNAIIAETLPDMTRHGDAAPHPCDRSASVTAQSSEPAPALVELIESLLDAVDLHQGAVRGFDLHGVMTGPDRCTIWGQACLAEPATYRSFTLERLNLKNAFGTVEIAATLRVQR